jgi:hypothetical protein
VARKEKEDSEEKQSNAIVFIRRQRPGTLTIPFNSRLDLSF